MKQTEISAAEWNTCCAEFSRVHHGWLITLAKIATAELEAVPEQVEAHWMIIADQVRFQELVLGPTPGSCDIVTKTQTGAAIVEHRLEEVVRLFRLTANDAHQGLRIDCAHAGTEESTLIWLRVAAAPEELNDITEFEM